MQKTYIDFAGHVLKDIQTGVPIYTNQIAKQLAANFMLDDKDAAVAMSAAFKRIMNTHIVSDLRIYQKGIYYNTSITFFGKLEINKEQLIAYKYILPDIGYETGYMVMHQLGLAVHVSLQPMSQRTVIK